MTNESEMPLPIRSPLISPRQICVLVAAAMIVVVLAIWAPNFFNVNNARNILGQTSVLAVLALGMSSVMIGGGIDLSLPFNAALSAVFGALYMRATGDALMGLNVMIVSGTAIGAFNGFAVGYLRMNPFVVTLAMMTVTNGAAIWMTNSLSIADIPDAFVDPFFTRYWGLPLSIYVAVVLTIIIVFAIGHTVFGKRLYAVGINEEAARVAGISVSRIKMGSYVLAGFIAGVAAILMTGRLASASANLASPILVLDVITACVVGGISIYGGVGRVGGAVVGALFITLMSNALNALEVSLFVNQIVRGLIIIAFVAFDSFARRGRS